MTTPMKITGLLATLIILLVIPVYSMIEPSQQENLLNDFYAAAVVTSTDIYAENCAVCHGADGQGIGDTPALNSEGIRTMPESELIKVISRGRDNTLMAAWAVEEGGILSASQISDMVVFIQQANWEYVNARVAELGLTPPEVTEMEVSEEMLTSLTALEGGESLSLGLTTYAENCAACHGSNGAGTMIAPALDSADLRATPRDEILATVNNGVNGTLMASWQNILAPEEIAATVDLLLRWDELLNSGVEFPEAEMLTIASSPEMIADGYDLFHIACKSCHGVDGYGTRMAPALNNEIFLSETPDAAIYQIIAGGVSGTLMPAWGSRLSDYDLQSLVAYLRSLEANAPAILPPIADN